MKELPPEPTASPHEIRCPACAAALDLGSSFLDPRTGKTVLLYVCRCGESIWKENKI